MKQSALKILKLLIIADILLILSSIIFFDTRILYNTQVAFVTSALVMVASMISYRRMVNARVEHNIITIDDSKDVIDKLEDPYDLYSEEIAENPDADLKEAIKEEKQKMKAGRRSVYETIKDTKAALSIYRVGAYILLVLGFLYLNRHGLLHLPSYLVSLSLPIILIVAVLVNTKENQTQDRIE